ncbi:MAG: chemotaxis protein CheA [Parasphingopyxis sp.]
MDELLAEFIAETRETLEKISSDLVAWEAEPSNRARLDEIFRFVHTVKGSCGFLDLPRLEKLSHCTEDLLQRFRSGEREPSHDLVSAILAVVDRITQLVDRLDAGESIDDGDDDDLLKALSSGGYATPKNGICRPHQSTSAASTPAARSIRVPVALLDQLMGGVSDLVLARNELSRQLRGVAPSPALEGAFDRLSQRIAEIRDGVTWTRMQRIESLFAAVPRLVRDLSEQLGKEVSLKIDGEDVELDREMIEVLRDPLTHAVRNALDHGIESPEQRREAGKQAAGTLELSARQSGNQIEITIRDDGAGIDTARIAERAVGAGVVSSEQMERLGEQARLDLIFQPGLSTVERASEISGRGVGMDVVRANVERIGGVISIASEPGSGTTLTLSVPLTLTIIPALIVGVEEHLFALPRLAVDEIIAADKQAVSIEAVGDTETVVIRTERLPLVRARDVVECPDATSDMPKAGAGIVMILSLGRARRFALLVSHVHDHEELVVKPAAPMLMNSGVFAGTALPDNGRPLLLLDAAGIAARAGLRWSPTAIDQHRVEEQAGPAGFDALVFDDLDGCRRAIPMTLVERIEAVDIEAVANMAGATRVMLDGKLLPLLASGPLPETGELRLFRLSDGDCVCAYAFEGQADAVRFPADYRRASRPGKAAGVGVVDGVPVELLDAHFLIAGTVQPLAGSRRARCRIAADDEGWAQALLGPLVELAGYDVVYGGETDDEPADLLLIADDTAECGEGSDDVLYLTDSRDAGPGRLYRYDREGIFDALRERLRGAGGR